MFILDFCKNTLIWTVFETKINISVRSYEKVIHHFFMIRIENSSILVTNVFFSLIEDRKSCKMKKKLDFHSNHPTLIPFWCSTL